MKRHNKFGFSAILGASRAARAVALSGILTLLLLVLLIVLNLAMGRLPHSVAKPDVTGKQTFQISSQTISFLESLDQDVTLYLICEGGKAAADGDLLSFLARYDLASSQVSLKVIDSDTDKDFLAAHGETVPSNMIIIVESDARYKMIDNSDLYYYYYYEASSGQGFRMTNLEYQYMVAELSKTDSTGEMLAGFVSGITPYFNGESCVTNAINYVTLDRVATACVLSGGASVALDAELTAYLADASFDVAEITTLSELPDVCDVLVIHSVQADLSADMANILSSYLANGGKLFLTTSFDETSLPNLASVLKPYGLGLSESTEVVCEGHTNYLLTSNSPLLFAAHLNSNHRFSSEFDGTFVVCGAHSITLTETEGVTLTPWLTTSAVGYLMDPVAGKQLDAPKTTYTVGAIAEKGDTQIVWISSSPSFQATINTNYAANGNFDLFLQILNHLSGVTNNSISIEARVVDVSHLIVSPTQFVVLGVILVVILPLIVAASGVGIWYVRKKR